MSRGKQNNQVHVRLGKEEWYGPADSVSRMLSKRYIYKIILRLLLIVSGLLIASTDSPSLKNLCEKFINVTQLFVIHQHSMR